MAGQIFMFTAIFQFFVSWCVYEDEEKSMRYLFTGIITFLIAFALIMGAPHAPTRSHHNATMHPMRLDS